MKKTIKLALTATMVLGATSAFATNGDTLIGLGAKARGMAGVGIGMSHGAEGALTNPALIKGNEISFGGTVFMPSVSFNNEMSSKMPDGNPPANPTTPLFNYNDYTTGDTQADSASDMSVIPEVAISMEVNDQFAWGIGMYGVAGMGVDYRDDDVTFQNASDESTYTGTKSGTNQMLTNLQLMRFVVPLAYKPIEGLSLAVSPILQYGSLSIAYNAGQYYADSQGTNHNTMTGRGLSQDFGFGFNVGVAYEIAGFTIGATYTSAISMTYDHQISEATKQFGVNGGEGLSDDLEQPAEFGIGVSYAMDLLGGKNTFAIDYKNIAWSSAAGYEDFQWDDQNVIIVGYQYATKKWAVRLGYNYASHPIQEQDAASLFNSDGTMNTQAYDNAVINYFNLAGFPATTESHIALGGSYQISDTIGVDFAYTFAPEVTETFDTTALSQAQIYNAMYKSFTTAGLTQQQAQQEAGYVAQNTKSEASVKHSQQAVTVAMTIKF